MDTPLFEDDPELTAILQTYAAIAEAHKAGDERLRAKLEAEYWTKVKARRLKLRRERDRARRAAQKK